jgi:hypothetical protein
MFLREHAPSVLEELQRGLALVTMQMYAKGGRRDGAGGVAGSAAGVRGMSAGGILPHQSQAEEVGLELGVAFAGGPEVERDGCQLIYFGYGQAVACEVYRLDVIAAGIAGLHADVRELVGGIDGELVFVFLAAVGAEEAAKLPLGETEAAKEEALGAVAFGAEHGDQGLGAAERAEGLHGGSGRGAAKGQ